MKSVHLQKRDDSALQKTLICHAARREMIPARQPFSEADSFYIAILAVILAAPHRQDR
jgi:hypothetical protein